MAIPWEFISIEFCECIIDVISGKGTNSVWFRLFFKLTDEEGS